LIARSGRLPAALLGGDDTPGGCDSRRVRVEMILLRANLGATLCLPPVAFDVATATNFTADTWQPLND